MYQILILLILSPYSTVCMPSLEEGSGGVPDNIDQEDDDHCVPVDGSYFNESVTTTASYHKAHVLAVCTWGCTNYTNNMFNSDDIMMWPIVIESCANGCYNRFLNETSLLIINLPTCVDICDKENECSDKEGKITNSDTIHCQSCLIGCEDIYEQLNGMNNNATGDVHNDTLQIYSSNFLPEIHVYNPINSVNSTVIVILLYNMETASKYYIVKQLNHGGNIIEVEYLSCKEVFLSYAYVNEFGIQRFSSERDFLISGVTPVEPAMLIDEVSYSEDKRPSFFGHYTMQLNLSYSSNMRSVQYFIIILRGIEIQQNECQPENFTVTPDHSGGQLAAQFDANDTVITYSITATHPRGPPLSNCLYLVQIVTVPKYARQVPSIVSDIEYRKVPPYTPPEGVMYCTRSLRQPDSSSYNVLIDMVLDEYVASEQVVEYIEIVPKIVTYSKDFHSVDDSDVYPFIKKYIQYTGNDTGTTIKYLLDEQLYEPKSTPTMIYQFGVYVYWKNDLLYRPSVQSYKCNVTGLSPQPDTIHFSSNHLSVSASRLSQTSQVNTNQPIHWNTPLMNGRFDKYQICLVDTALHHIQDPPIPTLQCHEISLMNQTSLPSQSTFVIITNENCLYIQMRSFNMYVASNWSEPLLVSVDGLCGPTTSSNSIPITTTTITDSIHSSISRNNTSTVTSTTKSYRPTVSSSPTNSTSSISNTTDKPLTGALTGGIVIMCIITVAIVIVIIILHSILRRRKRRLEFIEETSDIIFQMGPRIQLSLPVMEYDEWEVSPSQIIIDSALGQGAFGEVYKGIIEELPNNMAAKCGKKNFYNGFVAIKLLKTTATGDEKCDFLKEIDIMKRISTGNSPHVVNMVGCVTSQEPLSLITEFITHGDLLTYLRINRKSVGITTEEKQLYRDLNDLNAADLVAFGYQIASGMEYLGSIGIVHRDLACRNVLIGEGKSLKITDFGMSRVIGDHEDDAYIKTTKGRLPLKWMAIESIVDRQFTVMSDVWSYGVTLWEIATLGGFPYPTIANDKLLQQLKNGYRMEQPSNCSKEVYDIMIECWADNPKSRPKFSTLRKLFDKMLTAQNADSYIDLQTDESSKIYDATSESSTGSCGSDIRMTLSPVFRGTSSAHVSGAGSKCSIDNTTNSCLKVANPWERSSSAHNIIGMPDTLGVPLNRASSNCSTPLPVEGLMAGHQNSDRPRSAMIWPVPQPSPIRTKENLYVDQPGATSGAGASITVVVSSTAPSTPQKKQ